VKAVNLRYCLVSRFGLVAAFTIRSLYNSDNNVVSIELEISGALFLPCGHYISNLSYMFRHIMHHPQGDFL